MLWFNFFFGSDSDLFTGISRWPHLDAFSEVQERPAARAAFAVVTLAGLVRM